jgi:hypothetical protein
MCFLRQLSARPEKLALLIISYAFQDLLVYSNNRPFSSRAENKRGGTQSFRHPRHTWRCIILVAKSLIVALRHLRNLEHQPAAIIMALARHIFS